MFVFSKKKPHWERHRKIRIIFANLYVSFGTFFVFVSMAFYYELVGENVCEERKKWIFDEKKHAYYKEIGKFGFVFHDAIMYFVNWFWFCDNFSSFEGSERWWVLFLFSRILHNKFWFTSRDEIRFIFFMYNVM